jgi:hypothetical protein
MNFDTILINAIKHLFWGMYLYMIYTFTKVLVEIRRKKKKLPPSPFDQAFAQLEDEDYKSRFGKLWLYMYGFLIAGAISIFFWISVDYRTNDAAALFLTTLVPALFAIADGFKKNLNEKRHLVIALDLHNPPNSYLALYDNLVSCGAKKAINNVWILSINKHVEEHVINDIEFMYALKNFLGADDSILVCESDGGSVSGSYQVNFSRFKSFGE